jgi:hypothetical protein
MNNTRDDGACSRAFASSARARSYSLFSDSTLTAANHISSEFGLFLNAFASVARASATSPCVQI